MILQRDIRTPPVQAERRLQGHRQEVCGLKWSTDHQLLASGGNDNKVGRPAPPQSRTKGAPQGGGGLGLTATIPQLLVWNHSSLSPVQQYTEHLAAVKAIAWSPHQHGLLASGGGTADRCIRFWNTLTGQPLQCIDTGSQVCNLAWSKHANELVSAAGQAEGCILGRRSGSFFETRQGSQGMQAGVGVRSAGPTGPPLWPWMKPGSMPRRYRTTSRPARPLPGSRAWCP